MELKSQENLTAKPDWLVTGASRHSVPCQLPWHLASVTTNDDHDHDHHYRHHHENDHRHNDNDDNRHHESDLCHDGDGDVKADNHFVK